jgi:hypothetical protein
MGQSDGLFPAAAVSDAFVTFLSRTPAQRASVACSVAMIDLHSAQTMSAASCSFLSVGFEHVEEQRLDPVAGGAPYARELVQPIHFV